MIQPSSLTTTEIQDTDQALRAAMQAAGVESDRGYDWLSSRFSRVKFVPVDLIEVCGGSGYYGRPKRPVSATSR